MDGVPQGTVETGVPRVFPLNDGKHQIVFKYSISKAEVELTLSGDDSFTVFWDRIWGGMKIAEEFEGDIFFDRSSCKYLAICAAVVFISSFIPALLREGYISAEYAFAGYAAVVVILLLMFMYIISQRRHTFVWGKENP